MDRKRERERTWIKNRRLGNAWQGMHSPGQCMGAGEHLVGLTKHEVLPFFLGAGKMKSQANGGRADSHDEIES